jgi:predicted phage terminase large subunit-like protein
MPKTPRPAASPTSSSRARRDALSPTDLLIARSCPAGLAWVAGGKASHPAQGWVPFPHLLLLSDKIMQVATGQIPRLIVTMPPRHGKSELISRYGPAWFLGNYPNSKVMLAAYEAKFAASWGRKARDVLVEHGQEIFGVRVSDRTSASDYWEIAEHDGVMVTAGVGGGLTGKGARLLVIDDPVKNAEEASSEVIQLKQWEWWISTARTRLEQNAGAILVMTRWNEADLAGQLLAAAAEEGAEPWEVLNLPAFAEDADDALGRAEGEPLCPELFDKPTLELTRKQSSYWWASMYQQRPMPAEGGLFKRADFRWFHEDPENNLYWMRRDQDGQPDKPVGRDHIYRFVTCDPAFSEKETADYTALCLWGVTPWMDLLLLDVERVRFDVENLAAAIRRYYDLHLPTDLRVESKAYGTKVIDQLVAQGLPIVPLEADTDKITRALGGVPRYEVHAVYHRAGADWLEAYERELLMFPNGRNDDQVDAFAYAALALPQLQLFSHRQESIGQTETGGLATQQL